MGYTHYWTFKTPPKGTAKQVEASYQQAIKACNKVVRAWQDQNPKGSWFRDAMRLSGYSAHAEGYGGLEINGKGSNAHEPFTLREHYRQNLEDSSNFCKTARKPYDTVVVACLTILKHYLGDLIEISSDGCRNDWTEGVDFAKLVTKLKTLENPITEGYKLYVVTSNTKLQD